MSAKSQTLKYATVDGIDMNLEVIVPESATKENKAPIYLWFVSGFTRLRTAGAILDLFILDRK